jgi:ferredoxin-NADP reductase
VATHARHILERTFLTARLVHKHCISRSAQTYHFEFLLEDVADFPFVPGQFISAIAEDRSGREQTRAYSLASAPAANHFELCLNRVEGGFFSNRLADLPDVPIGAAVRVFGPNGFFTLREPLTDSILVATGTGIAPMRSMLQWLFPQNGPDRSQGKQIWLVYGTRHATELYYRDEFEALAARHPNFHYLPTLSRGPADWTGLRGYVQDHVAKIVEDRAKHFGQPVHTPVPDLATPAAQLHFDIHAYACGLSPMIISIRDCLKHYGWHRRQIVTERYD